MNENAKSDVRPSPPIFSSVCPYDAVLLVSFGGPEGSDEVMPFLENVVRGKNVPRSRLLELAKHYDVFDGVSPINGQNRAMLAALLTELNEHGPPLAVYWGNRNWHPLLSDTVAEMAEDGVQRALAFVTSAFGSYPGCRQYREDIEKARQAVEGESPRIEKLRLFYNHPGFIEAMVESVLVTLAEVPCERRSGTQLIYTAHSLPTALAQNSPYVHQLQEACRLVSEGVRRNNDGEQIDTWQLVFQSRSGPASQSWLEPDIGDYVRQLSKKGEVQDVVIVPIGFVMENLEVVYDLDVEVGQLCEQMGITMVRAPVVGTHPRFVRMIRELLSERLDSSIPPQALGQDGPWPHECSPDCCRP